MKILISLSTAIVLSSSTLAFAENCPKNEQWNKLTQNMHWTIFDDESARKCYYDNAGDGAYKALTKCNHVFNEANTGMLAELETCWPSNVCNWINANHAPGC